MSLTKLFLAGNNLVIPGQKYLVSDIPPGDRKISNIFYSVRSDQKAAEKKPTLWLANDPLNVKIILNFFPLISILL
jgi:hypothetical protein